MLFQKIQKILNIEHPRLKRECGCGCQKNAEHLQMRMRISDPSLAQIQKKPKILTILLKKTQ